MTPEFSRRVAQIMNTITILELSLLKRKAFIKRVSSKDNFLQLLKEDQGLIIKAEKELKGK